MDDDDLHVACSHCHGNITEEITIMHYVIDTPHSYLSLNSLKKEGVGPNSGNQFVVLC